MLVLINYAMALFFIVDIVVFTYLIKTGKFPMGRKGH